MKRLVKTNFILLFIFTIIGALFVSCEEELYIREIVDNKPVIASFNPSTGLNGTLITVKGEYLRNVDSAAFGNGEAVIYRIINDNELVLKVNNASASGNITLVNPLGESKSAESFTMQYVVPTTDEWPLEAEINQNVSITGTNLQSVTKVYFESLGGTDKSHTNIVFQSEDELVVQVPFVEADWANEDDVRTTINIMYNDETSEKTISGPQYSFKAIKPDYEVLSWPTAVLKNSEIVILGTNVNLTDTVYFGDQVGEIVKSTPYSITVLVPNFDERTYVDMSVVYFRSLTQSNPSKVEVYTKYRKTIGTFEGGISSLFVREAVIAPGVNWTLTHSTDTPLVAPEGKYYGSYTTDPDPANSSSVPFYFNYNEGDGNTINLNAFEDPVLHFYYYNDSTPAYMQLEIVVNGTKMRVYIERYRTNKTKWELVCIRLKDAQFGAVYDGPFAPLAYKGTYEEMHINFKADKSKSMEAHIDNIFISEGAIKGAVDLTKHTKENDHVWTIVE